MTQLNIAIIGGGIAGLAVGRAFSLLGYNITVFEKAKKLENIGGGITIYPHGARALSALGIKDMDRVGMEVGGLSIFQDNIELFSDSFDSIRSEFGFSLYSFARYELQDILAKSLPPGSIKLNAEVCDVEQNDKGVRLRLRDGSCESADLLILADGINSRLIRKCVNPELDDPYYVGYCLFGGFLEAGYTISSSRTYALSVMSDNRGAFILPLPNNRQWWYLLARLSEDSMPNGHLPHSYMRDLFANRNMIFDQILCSPQKDYSFGLACKDIRFQEQWYQGRIIALGDCIHAVGPTAGQGANSALIEALLLAHLLKSTGSYIEAFELFADSRNRVIPGIYDYEKKVTEGRLTSDQNIIQKRNAKLKESSISDVFEPVLPIMRAHHEVFSSFG